MKIGIQTNLWNAQLHQDQLETIIGEIAAAGYQGLEIDVQHLDLNEPTKLLALTSQAGLSIVGLHTSAPLFDSEKMKNEILPGLESIAAYAQAVQAQYLFISGKDKAVKFEIDFRIEAEMLNRAGRIAQKYGLRLGYHNHLWEVDHQLRELRALVSLTQPALVTLLLDVGWIKRAGGNPAEVTRDYVKRIGAFHFKDTQKDQWTEIGAGKVDFYAILKQLPKENDYWLIVEQENGLPNARESAARSAQNLNQLLTRLAKKKPGFFSRWTGRG